MKYRLYVSGCCNNTRDFESCMGIGGVILSDGNEEIVFSKDIGKGTVIEAHIHAILYGIQKIIKNIDVSSIKIYSTNLMIVNYMNDRTIEIPIRNRDVIKSLINITENLKVDIDYEYFEINDYKYVRDLAEEALQI